jgi:hypothetical protein
VVCGAVFESNIPLVSSGGCLKLEVVCLSRTVQIPDDLVSVWKDTILLWANDVMK